MPAEIEQFRQAVWEYYAHHGRYDLPWRQPGPNGAFDPYLIIVSELMLQQTQVPRVLPKYAAFIAEFPTVQALANATLDQVLRAWSGLGYNRRAKFLWQTAKSIMREHQGVTPDGQAELVALPGIGVNTAGAILAYGYNRPVAFLETNIRTVFIHHFFADRDQVSDAELLPLITAACDEHSPREWYWALMDYGTFLKQTVGNHSRRSNHYAKQSAFAGSRRQIRGQVLKLLGQGPLTQEVLAKQITDERLQSVLAALEREQLVYLQDAQYYLGGA